MATLRLHPCFYRPTTPPIGQSTTASPCPLKPHWSLRVSVKVAPPLIPDSELAIFRANLLHPCSCQSRKRHNAIGQLYSVLYIAACDWLRHIILHRKPGQRSHLLLIILHYVNVCSAAARIGPNSWNAGSVDKYQDAYWLFYWVTRITEEPGASPHELPTYQNIRISAFKKKLTAAIFKHDYNNV